MIAFGSAKLRSTRHDERWATCSATQFVSASADDVLAAGEGIETMLSLRCVLSTLPMAAALSANHLGAIDFPLSLRRLYIARDADAAGDTVVAVLTQRAKAAGIEAITLSPRLGDFNEDLHIFGLDALRAALRIQLAPEDVDRFLLSPTSASELFRTLGGQLLHRLFLLFFSLLTLFVLLSNGRSVANRFLETSDRLFGEAGEGLIEKMVDATRGTVNGTVLVAVGEGLLIGVGYLIAGVPNAVLFTIFTTAFAMIPFGAWAAFTAAALVLVSGDGSGLAAAGVFCWGVIVMLAGDHFVWPTLVGGSARLPVSSGFRRNLWRSRCFRSYRFVSGAGDHGSAVDRVARVGVPTRCANRSQRKLNVFTPGPNWQLNQMEFAE